MNKIIIHIEKSKDFYDGYAENCEGIYGAGESIEAVKENIVEAIRLLKEHNQMEDLPELLKGEYELEYQYDKSCQDTPIKKTLNDILLAVSWREMSHQYFGKNSAWLYHKLDGVDDKGNSCELTQSEQEQLKKALYDLADRIRRAADKI